MKLDLVPRQGPYPCPRLDRRGTCRRIVVNKMPIELAAQIAGAVALSTLRTVKAMLSRPHSHAGAGFDSQSLRLETSYEAGKTAWVSLFTSLLRD